MARRPWTAAEDERLRALMAEHRSHVEIAADLDRSVDAVGIRVARLGVANGASRRPWTETEQRDAVTLDWPTFHARYQTRTRKAWLDARSSWRTSLTPPEVQLTDHRAAVREVGGDAVIAACVHVPATDPTMWARLLAIGERDRIETLIIAGDIVTGDMFSHWPAATKAPWGWDAELDSLRRHLSAALGVFGRIVITPGNHVTNRIVRVTDGHLRLRHIIAMAELPDEQRERVETTDLDFVRLLSGAETFLVGHASSYSRIDGRVPWQYAQVMESHVIVGNGHRIGHQVSLSGRWHGWEIGTLARPETMLYAQSALTSYPRMLQAFATVRGGAVRIYGAGLPLTDWAAELKGGQP